MSSRDIGTPFTGPPSWGSKGVESQERPIFFGVLYKRWKSKTPLDVAQYEHSLRDIMSRGDIRRRIMAHNNEFQVGDTISFTCLGDGAEQEGILVQIIDCVYGLVETKWGTFKTGLSTSKIIKRGNQMTWNDLYLLLREKIEQNAFFGQETATVYCAGSGEYFPVDSVEVAGDTDVVDPDTLIIVIQN